MRAALRTQSPIEERMADALLALHGEEYANGGPPDIEIRSQVELGHYRVDFLLTSFCPAGWARLAFDVTSRLAVECDGHDWHDRTKEQAQRDRERDRFLLCAGYPTIRFTGAEIYGDAIACAYDAFAALTAINRLQARGSS